MSDYKKKNMQGQERWFLWLKKKKRKPTTVKEQFLQVYIIDGKAPVPAKLRKEAKFLSNLSSLCSCPFSFKTAFLGSRIFSDVLKHGII